MQLSGGDIVWSMSSYDYVSNTTNNIEKILDKDRANSLKVYGKRSGKRPFPVGYRPELDTTPLLGNDLTSRYL